MPKLGVYADHPIPAEWTPILEHIRPVQYRWQGQPIPDLSVLIHRCLIEFSPEHQTIIWQRTGMNRTLQEIGDDFGLTRERIRQITNRAHRRFRVIPAIRAGVLHLADTLSTGGPVAIDLSNQRSDSIPTATPAQLWTFTQQLLRDQSRFIHSAHLSGDLYLISSTPLPSEQAALQVLMNAGSFMHHSQLAVRLGIPTCDIEAVLATFPSVRRTNSGLYGSLRWNRPQLLKAVAEQLARHGVTEWHYSTIGKAAATFDPRLADQPSRTFAAVLSRPDTADLFVQAGRTGMWRLKALGDGQRTNAEAIEAVLRAAPGPMHWRDVKAQLNRTMHDGTITAAFRNSSVFRSYGRGVYGLTDRTYPETPTENAFILALLREYDTPALNQDTVHDRAQAQGLNVAALIHAGAYSPQFRYWRGKGTDGTYMSAAEFRRRAFYRWYQGRDTREIPSEDIIAEGLVAAASRNDTETVRNTTTFLLSNGTPLPTSVLQVIPAEVFDALVDHA